MDKIIPVIAATGVFVVAGWLAWGSIDPSARPPLAASENTVATTSIDKTVYECNGDGKICSDGSIVGRTGPRCEFTACPSAETTAATIRTTMGQRMTGLNVSITPRAVLDDSRCPVDVQCIWAGTVYVRAAIQTGMGSSDHTLEIGKAIQTDGYTITFTELTPAPRAGETVPESSYRFVFTVSK